MRPVIIVFAKAPVAGHVKTRLSPPLTPSAAARLHEEFVRATLLSLSHLPDIELELHTDIETDAWRDLQVCRRLQSEGDLALRIFHALNTALNRGHPRAAIVGSDSPTLPPSYVSDLISADADVALGPTEDGGYYALAVRRIHPEMFAGVSWSCATTLESTVRACEAAGLSVALGSVWFDIDTPADLERIAYSSDPEARKGFSITDIAAANVPRMGREH